MSAVSVTEKPIRKFNRVVRKVQIINKIDIKATPLSKINESPQNTWKALLSTRKVGVEPTGASDLLAIENISRLAEKYRRFTCATMHRILSLKLTSFLQPLSSTVYASILIADISGFTRLSSRLSAEELKQHINTYFSLLLGIVKKNGGDVVKFLGDAVLIIFPVDVDADMNIKAATNLMASLCALHLIRECGNYRRGEGQNEVCLSLHCGISCGLVHCLCVGEEEHWEFIISGDPLFDVGSAIVDAATGETCLSSASYDFVKELLEAKKNSGGSYTLTGKRVAVASSPDKYKRKPISYPEKPLKDKNKSVDSYAAADSKFTKKNSQQIFLSSSYPDSPMKSDPLTLEGGKGSAKNGSQKLDAKPTPSSNSRTDNLFTEIACDELDIDDSTSKLSTSSDTSITYEGIKSGLADGIHATNGSAKYTSKTQFDILTSLNGDDSPTNSPPNASQGNGNSSNHFDFSSSQGLGNSTGTGIFLSASSLARPSKYSTGSTTSHIDQQTVVGKIADKSLSAAKTQLTTQESQIARTATDKFKSLIKGVKPSKSLIKKLSDRYNVRNSSVDDSESESESETLASHRTLSQGQGGENLNAFAVSQDLNNPFALLEKNTAVRVVKLYLHQYLHHGKADDYSFKDEEVSSNPNSHTFHNDPVISNLYLSSILKFFVHDAVRAALQSDGASYLFELRNVTTLFVEFLGLENNLRDGVVDGPQKAFSACLSSLKRFGGSLRQFTVDDKGCVLIGAFGLPGSSHEDNSRRAVEAAVSIRESLEAFGFNCREGISEGRVFCGLVGSAERCEYAMMGCSVNLAARLMGKCQPGEILVSEAVYLSSRSAFVFSALPRVVAKGYLHPVAVYRPTERACGNILQGLTTPGDVGFVGRENEVGFLSKAISECKDPSSSQTYSFMIEGPPSVGKTRLVAEALKVASNSNGTSAPIKALVGTATAAHIYSPYYVIRQILEQALDLKIDRSFAVRTMVSTKFRGDATGQEGGSGGGGGGGGGSGLACADESLEMNIRLWITSNLKQRHLDMSSLPSFIDNSKKRDNSDSDSFHQLGPQSPVEIPVGPSRNGRNQLRKQNSLIRRDGSVKGKLMRLSSDIEESAADDDGYAYEDLVPLLHDVLGVALKDNDITATMNDAKRKRIAEAFALKIIYSSMESNFSVFLIDNLQWCDWMSLRIIVRLVHRFPRGVFIGTARSDIESLGMNGHGSGTERHRRIKAVQTLTRVSVCIRPPPLNAKEVRTIIERTIGARLLLTHPGVLSSSNVDRIMERSGGSPAHAAVLASGLKSALTTGKFTGVQNLKASEDNLIISRFDNLSKPDQVVIKTASVIGMTFLEKELRHVLNELGLRNSVDSLPLTISNLIAANIIIRDEVPESYRFSDRSVQEGIYNLMLAAQRERVHCLMGYYHEREQTDESNRFEDIVRHFSLSDDLMKKIEYLSREVDIAKSEHKYDIIYRNLADLVKIATGIDCDDLIQRCSRLNSQTSDSVHSIWNVVLYTICLPGQLMTSFRQTTGGGVEGRILEDEFTKSLKLKRWMTGSDFHSNFNNDVWDSKIQVRAGKVASWIAEMGHAQFQLGNFVDGNNLFQFSSWNFNIPLPGSTLATMQSSNSFAMLTLFFMSPSHPLPPLPDLPLEYFFSVVVCLENLVLLYLLRGKAEDALKYARLLHRTVAVQIDKTSKMSELQGLVPINVRTDAILCLCLLASATTEREVLKWRTDCDILREQNKLDPRNEANLDVLLMFCFACMHLAECNFTTASELLYSASKFATFEGHQVYRCTALLGIAWCSFLSGKPTGAQKALEQVFSFAVQASHNPLHVWALELDILMKTLVRDFEGAEEAQRLIRSLQKKGDPRSIILRKEYFNATTSAVVAYSMVANQQFERGCVHAMYACKMLASKKQGVAIGGVLLFCAVYSLLDVVEYRQIAPMRRATSMEGLKTPHVGHGGAQGHGHRHGGRAASSPGELSFNTRRVNDVVVRDANKKVMEIVHSSIVSLNQLALRFPCLIPLIWALTTRTQRLEGCGLSVLVELDDKMSAGSKVLREFTFANAYVHWQRLFLCRKLGVSSDFLRVDDSKQISKVCFEKLGGCPHEFEIRTREVSHGSEDDISEIIEEEELTS